MAINLNVLTTGSHFSPISKDINSGATRNRTKATTKPERMSNPILRVNNWANSKGLSCKRAKAGKVTLTMGSERMRLG